MPSDLTGVSVQLWIVLRQGPGLEVWRKRFLNHYEILICYLHQGKPLILLIEHCLSELFAEINLLLCGICLVKLRPHFWEWSAFANKKNPTQTTEHVWKHQDYISLFPLTIEVASVWFSSVSVPLAKSNRLYPWSVKKIRSKFNWNRYNIGKNFQDLYMQVAFFQKCVRHWGRDYVVANQNSSPEPIYKYYSLTPLTL